MRHDPKFAGHNCDAAIIDASYYSLARSYELPLLEVEHPAGDLTMVLILCSKTDLSGEGRLANLAPRSASSSAMG